MKAGIIVILMLFVMGKGGYSMEKKIGNKNIGYIVLPEKFIKFEEATGTTGDIQYSDGVNIFTLNIFQDKNHTLETAANAIYNSFINKGIYNLQGAEIKFVDKYQCFQIYGEYNNFNNMIVAYVFKRNKNIHLIVFEGPKEYLKENLTIAETYSSN